MKRKIRKILSFLVALAIIAVTAHTFLGLHPAILFNYRTEIEGHRIYAEEVPPLGMHEIIAKAESIISDSEIYDPEFKIRIILAREHFYNRLFGQRQTLAYATHYNVILAGHIDAESNELNWGNPVSASMNLTTTLAHEMVHCLQGQHHGFVSFSIINKQPFWKQEGYAEYISQSEIRKNPRYTLAGSINMLLSHKDNYGPVRGWITVEDGFDRPLNYFRYRLLVEYLFEVEDLAYQDFMDDKIDESQTYDRMMNWYRTLTEENASPTTDKPLAQL